MENDRNISLLPLVRPQASNTNMATGGKAYTRSAPPRDLDLPHRLSDVMEDEDDLPTPKANPDHQRSPLSYHMPKRQTFESIHTQFEEYEEEIDMVEESQFLPFGLSTSLKKTMKRPRSGMGHLDSLIIPSPSLWPNVKHHSFATESSLCAVPRTPLSPLALAALDNAMLRPPVPATQGTPSLTEGSSVTDEAPSMSCPPTPSLGSTTDDASPWSSNFNTTPLLGCELPPLAMKTLMRLSSENAPFELLEDDEEPVPVKDPYEMADKGLSIMIKETTVEPADDEDDVLSPISVPSPGGFFANLRKSSAEIWTLPEEVCSPVVGNPDSLYDFPRPPSGLDLNTDIPASSTDPEDPLTARRITFDLDALLGPEGPLYELEGNPFDGEYESQIPELDDVTHDATYAQQLCEVAADNVNRTSDWIKNQEVFMDTLRRAETRKEAKASTPKTTQSRPATPVKQSHQRSASEPSALATSANITPSKKSVRFADDIATPASTKATDNLSNDVPRDSVLYHAFQHLTAHSKPRDAYLNRESRTEALRMQRRYRRTVHHDRLQGSFALEDVITKAIKREREWAPSGAALSEEEQRTKDEQRKTLAGNSKQRRALEQLDLNTWYLQGLRFMDGGSLLPSTAAQHLACRLSQSQDHSARILDFGGQPTAHWGWAIAVEHRAAKVYTVIPSSNGLKPDWLAHRGPSNHRIATVENAWTLPFPAGFFDIISARSLHAMLKTTRPSHFNGKDEWEATLAELHRVLAPGGVMHFALLDAEVAAPSNLAIAGKSVEFAVGLRTRGYDPCAGRHMMQRVAQAGFADVKQSWIALPWVSAEKQGHDQVTGLLGSVSWEQWLLKFQMEVGRPEEVLLEGVAETLEEARLKSVNGESVGWRTLVGCARKA